MPRNTPAALRLEPAPTRPDLRAVPARPTVVIDEAPAAWQAASEGRLEVLPPSQVLAGRLAQLDPPRLIVNLAAPGALEALGALRAAGCAVPASACVANGLAGRGLALGAVEALAAPLDPEAAAAVIAGHAGRGAKVVTIGPDIDAMVALRYWLTHRGMSVAMAWDARQAADLLPMVRPQLIVLDLALPAGEGYSVLASVAGPEPAPTVALIPGDQDPAPRLAALLAQPAHASRAVPLARLLRPAHGG
jgi:CheY-like chemotaxis protein